MRIYDYIQSESNPNRWILMAADLIGNRLIDYRRIGAWALKYRVPEESEFVQGFEFEVLDWSQMPTGMVVIENGEMQVHDFAFVPKVWNPMKVTWMYDPNETVVQQHGEYTVYIKGSFYNFFKPFEVAEWLKQGRIRVKI